MRKEGNGIRIDKSFIEWRAQKAADETGTS
jgi:hypothetical protein